jgi:serine/threonine-protein kinase
MKAMARERDARYATAAELQAELDEYLAELGSNVRNRDIGATVAELFADVRADTRSVVEQQIRKVTALTAREYQSFRPLELATTVLSGARTFSETDTTVAPPREKKTLRFVVAAAVLLGLGVAALAWNRSSPSGKVEPNGAGLTSASPATGGPSLISVKLASRPDTAQIFVDDRPVSGNPATLDVHADGSRHTVRAEAPGHAVRRQEIVYDRDQALLLTLDELPRAPSAAPNPKPREAPRAPRHRGKCDPPYVIDARGVKKFKPECL